MRSVFNTGPDIVLTSTGRPIGLYETAEVPDDDPAITAALARGHLTSTTTSPPEAQAPPAPEPRPTTDEKPSRGTARKNMTEA